MYKDDWKTIGFVIPRNLIQSQFIEKELQYNCIYFLIGFDGIKEKIYVGQAKKRNNGGSVLYRLREHDKNVMERYNSIWTYSIIITNIDDIWGPTELNQLESSLYDLIPKESRLNGNTPNFGGSNNSIDYKEKIRHIIDYNIAIGVNTFNSNNTNNININNSEESLQVENLSKGSRIQEIVTPLKVVKQMIDMLPSDVWNDKTVFLDPACKGGEYLREIYERLMETESLKAKYLNDIERAIHILDNQLYGIAISETSKDRTIRKLNGYSNNIFMIDNYIEIVKGKKNIKFKEVLIREFKNRFGSEKFREKFGDNMKIDVIIGNPPYQDSNNSGNGGGGTAIYDKFVLGSLDISDRIVSFITPARWYTDENKVLRLKETLLECNNIRELHDFDKTEDVFKGVYIMGGVCYYILDKKYHGICKVVEHRNGDIIVKDRYIKEDCLDIFVRNYMAVDILKKVINNNNNFLTLYDYIQDYNIFGLRSYERGFKDKDVINNVKMYYTGNNSRGGGVGYISDNLIANSNFIDKHKVFINSVSDNMLGFPYKTLYKGFYGEPGSVCTESYLMIGPVKKKEYADNIIKYLSTQFVRFLVQQRKTSQLAYKKVYKFVPLQDFSSESDINWSQSIQDVNEQLYKKYSINFEESKFIESTIKYMD